MSKNVKISNPMKVITGVDTRWSYANVWEPKSINGGTPKYSVSLIIQKVLEEIRKEAKDSKDEKEQDLDTNVADEYY